MPMPLRMAEAPVRTVSVASERMPPTTGTMLEMAMRVAFKAVASAAPAAAPLRVR